MPRLSRRLSWLVYLSCHSPWDSEPSRIYSRACSAGLWGLCCSYSLCLAGGG